MTLSKLAERLYARFRAFAPDVHPVWGNLDAWEREAWEAVAQEADAHAVAAATDVALRSPVRASWVPPEKDGDE